MGKTRTFSLRKYKFEIVASSFIRELFWYLDLHKQCWERTSGQPNGAGTRLVATTQRAPVRRAFTNNRKQKYSSCWVKVEVAKEATVAKDNGNAASSSCWKNRSSERAATVQANRSNEPANPEKATARVATATSSRSCTESLWGSWKTQSIEWREYYCSKPGSKGYKGKGMSCIAVIDSGLDVNHEVLRITDLLQLSLKTKEKSSC